MIPAEQPPNPETYFLTMSAIPFPNFSRQFNCKYCKIVDSSSLKDEEMTTDEVVEALRLISTPWPGAPVAILGGEPTTREDLPKEIEASIEFGIHTIVISNSKRVLKDASYRKALVAAGLKNWSVSCDGFSSKYTVDKFSWTKSDKGLRALRMFRDNYGFTDLVASIAVTYKNIGQVPSMVELLTKEGIWTIVCPCQTAKPGYQYSSGDPEELPTRLAFMRMGETLSKMARSGKYLMHNRPEWFEAWVRYGYNQDWVCSGKQLLTIDADGYLRRCIEIPLEKDLHILDLDTEKGRKEYAELLIPPPKCRGCFWDCAFETQQMKDEFKDLEARAHFRHER